MSPTHEDVLVRLRVELYTAAQLFSGENKTELRDLIRELGIILRIDEPAENGHDPAAIPFPPPALGPGLMQSESATLHTIVDEMVERAIEALPHADPDRVSFEVYAAAYQRHARGGK